MKNYQLLALSGLLTLGLLAGVTVDCKAQENCSYHRDSMQVVMRFEIKVKPEYVGLLKESFDACKKEVLAKEPGCLNYTMFQSYNDSTVFCINETWATKADHDAHMQLEHTRKHLSETRDIRDNTFRSNSNYVYWICPGANDMN
jgi:quinol monooxygenase YgiN